ncbi:rhoGEF domain-containing protein gxcI isoform X2 [Hyalella azteca]|uniref:RhoGEF domain-containing protein gxcI isoform X2 n=1 Tax=Hyalella azteca TaxID=294128 RepID=A0A8B7NP82_HYAAZ|nr:rhoGEF domain-containing protein gxcI isoform X2 [Hyalella azteca]
MTHDYRKLQHLAVASERNVGPGSGMRTVPYYRSPCAQRIRRWRSGGCSETMERLMRLVVAQGETIQNQLRRLNQRESQIESYEQQMHLLRVQSLGNDYLLSSYLHDQHHQAQDQPHGMEQVMGVDSGSKYSSHHRNSLLPPARLQSGPHVQFNQAHPTLLPSMSDTREVHAKPINIGGGPNDLFIQDAATCINTAGRNNFVRSMKSTEPLRYSGRLNRSNKDETLDEEKSKDSGILFAEETDDISHRDIEDLNEAEVQERLALFNKMETILNRMLEEEEKIHGLRSTIEVIQTQQKQEKNILECDLKRAADDHAALVAEVRSNEQQIRVLDTSAAQKKKLIDALLADEVDSDQETKYLQAKLDYILHLPPTAFRLPEEGDDPPPLPPPPAHPACLVQSLLPNHPPQLVNPITTSYRQPSPNQQKSSSQTQTNKHFHSRSSSSDNRPPCGASHRPPSPNVLYNNRAPSPSIFGTVNRAPSPGPRLPNRSCSPNRRKPLQPPPYEHHKLNGNLTTIDSTSVPLLRSSVSGSNPTLQSQINNKNFQSSYSLKNTFTSVNVLPNRTDLSLASNQNLNSSEQNQNTNSLKNINSIHLRINTFKKQVGEDNDEDVPPPLPLCPPPLLTPPANAKDIMQSNTYNIKSDMNGEKSRTDFSNNEASKRNLLNTIGSRIVSGKSSKSVDDDDNDSTTNNSSLGLSSRSSTSSEASMSNCSSSVSSGVGVDSFPSSNINKMQRTRNQISAVNGKDSSVKSHSLLLQNNSITSSTDQLVLSGTTDVKKDSDSGDSNSDTGLSSLHSSSDEAAYALDTLV